MTLDLAARPTFQPKASNWSPQRLTTRVWELAVTSSATAAGRFPVPKQCEIHVGADDWQSDPGNVKAFALAVGIAVKVVPNAGHSLPKEYVGILLDRWTKTLI